jgi:hypothetical protein
MKVLLLFPDPWADKSQTFKNILKYYEDRGDECLALINGKFILGKNYKSKIFNHNLSNLISRACKYIDRLTNSSLYCYVYSIFLLIKYRKIIKLKFDRVIIFDYQLLFFIKYLSYTTCYYISLELPIYGYNKYLYKYSKLIDLIYIQSTFRLSFLQLQGEIKHKILHNSSTVGVESKNYPIINRLVHCGTLNNRSGLNFLLEIADFGYQIDIIGGETEDMLESENYIKLKKLGRINVINKFYDDYELANELSKYLIGIAFYDIYTCSGNEFKIIDSSPSGKILLYASSMLPVISNNISSNFIIKNHNSGELITSFSIGQFNSKFDSIVENYDKYIAGCISLSKYANFNENYVDNE